VADDRGKRLAFALGRTLEITGMLVAVVALGYGVTADERSPGLTVEFLGAGLGLLLFYVGRNLVSRSLV
jgi:hypothetical protein